MARYLLVPVVFVACTSSSEPQITPKSSDPDCGDFGIEKTGGGCTYYSCSAMYAHNASQPVADQVVLSDGTQIIDPDGDAAGAPFAVFCNMTNNWGDKKGWTLVLTSEGVGPSGSNVINESTSEYGVTPLDGSDWRFSSDTIKRIADISTHIRLSSTYGDRFVASKLVGNETVSQGVQNVRDGQWLNAYEGTSEDEVVTVKAHIEAHWVVGGTNYSSENLWHLCGPSPFNDDGASAPAEALAHVPQWMSGCNGDGLHLYSHPGKDEDISRWQFNNDAGDEIEVWLW